ncbi:MAG: 4Fe-4S ferredoxin [Clostridiales bacterium]|jgi:ferredoxin like protein|nr:4Fe-4S ferredoxin [Clostridiales bacterium]
MCGEDYLRFVKIAVDEISHIHIRDSYRCNICDVKPCTYVCPSGVFFWNTEQELLDVMWRRCVECGACEPCCPGNIELHHPRGGFGVSYHA